MPLNSPIAFYRQGSCFFRLGLLTGFIIPAAQIPRMALSSHLEGIMNGSFLFALGLCW
jgi:hydroxylaminobenzene mutase